MAESPQPPPLVPAEDVTRRYALQEREMTLEAGVRARSKFPANM
jgi:hypothetical protein